MLITDNNAKEKQWLRELLYQGQCAYTEQQMDDILSKSRSTKNLRLFISYYHKFIAWSLTPSHIFILISHGIGDSCCASFEELLNWAKRVAPLGSTIKEALDYTLDGLQMDLDQAVNLAGSINGGSKLDAYRALIPWAIAIAPPALAFNQYKPKEALAYALTVLGINNRQVLQILANRGGTKSLQVYQDLMGWVIAITPPALALNQHPTEISVYALDILGINFPQVLKIFAINGGGAAHLQAYRDLIPWAIKMAPPSLGLTLQNPKAALVYALGAIHMNHDEFVHKLTFTGGLRWLNERKALVATPALAAALDQQAPMPQNNSLDGNENNKRDAMDSAIDSLGLEENSRHKLARSHPAGSRVDANLQRTPTCEGSLNLLYFSSRNAGISPNVVLLEGEVWSLSLPARMTPTALT